MKLTIERDKWQRGEVGAKLLSPETGKMCCLGFYCLAIGMTPEQIVGQGTPWCVSESLPPEGQWLVGRLRGMGNVRNADPLMLTNDKLSTSEHEREKELAKEFAEHGVEVEFV
jgi:hypothetical protein